MKLLHFGPAAQPLLGALHSPPRLRPPSTAVLLCNPFAEEGVRAHRTFRVLANQLERRGFPVLRFDYRATGDSMGTSEDVSLAAWRDDIALAAAELLSRTQAKRLVVVGLRLGGTLAALATSHGLPRPRHLVLWDPIVNGSLYLSELGALHRTVQGPQATEPVSPANASERPTEVLGTVISADFASDLEAIDLAAAPPRCDHLTIVTTGESPGVGRLRRFTDAPGARWLDVPAGTTPWGSAAAFNASVVPTDALQAVITRIVEVSPDVAA